MKKSKSKSKQKSRKSFSPFAFTVLAIVVIIGAAIIISIVKSHYDHAQAIIRLQELSNHDSGTTLDEIIATVQSEKPQYEIIFVFDEDGNKLIEYTNQSAFAVSLPDEATRLLQRFSNLQHVHNHPLTDSGHSDNDLAMPSKIGLDQAITTLSIITSRHIYSMSRGSHPWPTVNKVYEYFMQRINNYDPDVDPVLMESITIDGQEYGYYTNDCLALYAQYFDYSFTVTNTSISTRAAS